MMTSDDRPLPLLPDQRPPKFPASLGACLTRNGDETHLRILQSQFGDWTSREPIYLLTKKDSKRNPTESPRRKRESKLTESFQQSLLRKYMKQYGETPYETFKRIAKTVRIITSVCLALKRYIKGNESSEWSFIEMYLHVKKDMKDILVFNPYNFTNDQPMQQITGKLRRSLTTIPSQRTPADILLILTFLRNIKCFKDYPPYTQIELCKCMILQSYESRRIVVKQGQPPSSFYIVKSGTLLINVTETNLVTGKKFYRSCAELKEGDCFGEVGLLERCNRTGVICKTDCQLLLILQDDFDRLIREPLLQQKQEHINFCQRINLFNHFPCEIFSSHPNEFFYQYFPKNSIITNEAGDFKYLIIVMTGKCRLVSCFDPDNKNTGDNSSYNSVTKIKKSFKTRGKTNVLTQLPPVRERSLSVIKDTALKTRSRRSDSVPNLRPTLLKSKFSQTFCHPEFKIDEVDEDDDAPTEDIHIQISGNDSGELVRKVEEKLQLSQYNRLLKRAAVCHRLKKSLVKDNAKSEIYAQLAEFTSGSVFGLESLVTGGRKGFKMISDGVECIFVSKRLFLSEANIKVLSIVNDMMMTFPTDEEITNQVKERRSWYNYKQRVFKSSLKNSKYLFRQNTVI